MLKIGVKKGFSVSLLFAVLFALSYYDVSLAQEKEDKEPCPKPYIKLIKPKVAKAGEQITIRGHRFGEKEQAGEVIFSPGISGNIISWSNSRLTVEVPAGAQTGDVVVNNRCASSNGEIIKIEIEGIGK